MPSVRSLVSAYYILLAVLIFLNGEIISFYSCCVKKGLIYITIIAPFGRQLAFYLKYTKVNTCSSCDVHSVSDNKYIFLLCWYYEYFSSPS